VADMAVSVQAEAALCAEVGQHLAHALQQLVTQALVGGHEFGGNEVIAQQELAARHPELLEVQRGPIPETAAGSRCVQATEAATQQAQQFTTWFRCMAAASRVYGKQEVTMGV